jgi:indolepyruvate ferredoxin oxidoreductase alpha subunit
MKKESGVRVLIAEEPCVLYARRSLKKIRPRTAFVAVQGPETLKCAEDLACPAFNRRDDTLSVDETLCGGCMICMQISSNFKAQKR